MRKYLLIFVKIITSAAFCLAGMSKLVGAGEMVAVFEEIGFGQWFRYVTGVIELGAVVLLWIKNLEAFGAAALLCTMIGAVAAHILILGPSMIPAAVLAVLSAFILYQYRAQLPLIKKGLS